MENGEQQNGSRLIIPASIGGLILAAGVLISVGKVLNTVEHQVGEIAEVRMELATTRGYIDDAIASHYTEQEAVKDLAYISMRIENIERRLERMEERPR